MNKQIEEMAKTCPYNVRGECGLDETRCTTDCEVAQWGYCKASDVAMEIFAEIEKEIIAALESNYKAMNEKRMFEGIYYVVQGKIAALRGIEGFVDELKKKYEIEQIAKEMRGE